MISTALFAAWNALVLWLWVSAYLPSPGAIAAATATAWREGAFAYATLARNWAGFLGAAVFAAGTFGAASAAGGRWLRWIGRSGGPGAGLAGMMAGIGLAGSALLGAGLTGLLFAPPAWAACGVFLPFSVYGCRLAVRAGGRVQPGTTGLSALAVALTVLALGSALGALFSVETGWDALMYHLRLPSFHVYRHKVWNVWHSYYSAYPAQFEMLYAGAGLLPRWLPPDLVARMIHGACAVVLCVAAAGFCREFGVRSRLAPVLVAACPAVLALVPRAYVDLGTAAFGSVAILEWIRAARGRSAAGFVCGAALAGFAMGAKYAGVLVLPALVAAAWPPRCARGLAAAAAVLPVAPWLARNWIWLGNPVAPFLSGAFGSATTLPPDVTPWFEAPGPIAGLIASMPVRVLSLLLEPGHLGSPLSPVFAGLLPLVCLPERDEVRRRGRRAALSFILAWVILAPGARFVLAALPALAALIAARLEGTAPWPAARRTGIRIAVEASVLAGCACAVGVAATTTEPLGMVLGRRSAKGLLASGLPPAPYRYYATEAVNARVPRLGRVLVVSHFSTYYIERECLADFHTGRTRLAVLLGEAPTAERLAVRFRQLGIGWILFTAPGVADFARMPDVWSVPPGAWDSFHWVMSTRAATDWQTNWFVLVRLGARHEPRTPAVLPARETLFFAEADRRFSAGDAAGALVLYRAAPAPLAGLGSTAFRIGAAYMALGSFPAALESLKRARALGVNGPGLHEAMAQACVRLGRGEEAVAEYRAAVREDPLSPVTAAGLAGVLGALGRRDEAEASARAAARLRPEGEPLASVRRMVQNGGSGRP